MALAPLQVVIFVRQPPRGSVFDGGERKRRYTDYGNHRTGEVVERLLLIVMFVCKSVNFFVCVGINLLSKKHSFLRNALKLSITQ